jgi:hypothetical protein
VTDAGDHPDLTLEPADAEPSDDALDALAALLVDGVLEQETTERK